MMEIQYKNTDGVVLTWRDIDWLVPFYKAKCTVQWAD